MKNNAAFFFLLSLFLLLTAITTRSLGSNDSKEMKSASLSTAPDSAAMRTSEKSPNSTTETVKAIVYGTIGSLIAFAIQLGSQKANSYFRHKAINRFWSLSKGKITIVHPIFHDEKGAPIAENLARMEIVSALHALMSFLRDQGIPYAIQSDHHPIPQDSDIILVSSPKGNRQSAALCMHNPPPFEIKPKGNTFTYRDRFSSVEYESPVDRSGDKVDIGMIARVTDQSNRRIFLAWGIHIPGTLAAIKFITTPDKLRKLHRDTKHGDISFLAQASFFNITDATIDVTEPKMLTSIHKVMEGQKWG